MIACRSCLLALLGLLTACMTPPLKEAVSTLEKAPICCTNLSALPYQKLIVGQESEIHINHESPAYAFEAGKSYFAAFVVEPSVVPLLVIVRSFFSGDVFYPMVSVLNSDFVVVRTVGTESIRYYPPTWTDRGQIRGAITIDTSKDEKYFVVHTASRIVGGAQYSRMSGYAYSTGTGAVFVPGGGVYVHQYSTMGWLKISLEEPVCK